MSRRYLTAQKSANSEAKRSKKQGNAEPGAAMTKRVRATTTRAEPSGMIRKKKKIFKKSTQNEPKRDHKSSQLSLKARIKQKKAGDGDTRSQDNNKHDGLQTATRVLTHIPEKSSVLKTEGLAGSSRVAALYAPATPAAD